MLKWMKAAAMTGKSLLCLCLLSGSMTPVAASARPAAAASAAAPAAALAPIRVTGHALDGRVPVKTAAVVVLDRARIETSSAMTLAALLAEVTGVTIRSRGAPGVQADVGIRGGGFEQTLVLVDGIPIRNPQTGHHNLDLPLGLAAIERVVIIKGPGAIGHGGSATSGVINIITRRPDTREGALSVSVGSHRSRGLRLYLGQGGEHGSQMLAASVGRAASEHARRPNDADVRDILYTGRHRFAHGWLGWGAGSARKAFGAWGFYSQAFPNAREQTHSRLAWVGGGASRGRWSVSSRLYWNGHQDRFLTLIGGAGFLNRHDTDVVGLLARARRSDSNGSTAFGLGYRHAAIQSNALLDHDRNEHTLWLYRRQHIGARWLLEVGLNHAAYRGYDDYWLPSAALSWQFTPGWNLYASAARSARIPSYTELYLDTVANRGNPDLVPEVARTGELGLHGRVGQQTLQLAWFERRADNLIDWMATPPSPTQVALNVHGYRARGVDASWRWRPDWRALEWLRIGYSHLHVNVAAQAASIVYALHVPRQTWRLQARVPLAAHWALSVDGRRPEYAHQRSALLLGAKLTWSGARFNAALTASNLGNKKVIEAGFAPIPGRRFRLSLGVRF